jgi:hypothetical protein
MPLFDILFNEEQRRLYDLHTVIGEVGRLMQSDGGINALISPWVTSRLSSLAVFSDCLHQLHLFKPWSRSLEDDMEVNRSIIRDRYEDSFKHWIPTRRVGFEGSQVYRRADPTDGKFTCPIQRRRNKQNVETLRKAEANLDTFWKAVDEHYLSKGVAKS